MTTGVRRAWRQDIERRCVSSSPKALASGRWQANAAAVVVRRTCSQLFSYFARASTGSGNAVVCFSSSMENAELTSVSLAALIKRL